MFNSPAYLWTSMFRPTTEWNDVTEASTGAEIAGDKWA